MLQRTSHNRSGRLMTDYDKLSDEELSALVAEKVFGWRRYKLHGRPGHRERIKLRDGRMATKDADEKAEHDIIESPDSQIKIYLCCGAWGRCAEHDLSRWASSIADAWEVVEKLGCGLTLESFGLGCREFSAGFWKHDQAQWVHGEAPTAPHAICLAALRAVGAIE